jgi:two-component system, NarL family, nitrate/nitrite response regulator NarL
MGDRLRVGIIDDHPLFREGVVHTLRSARVLDVVGEGGTAEDALRIAKEELPDILLLDVSMPGGGIEVARLIARVCPIVKMIMLTVSENEDDVAQALEAGAKGYVLKGTSGPELLKTMFAISRGESYVTPGLAARLLTHAIRQEPPRPPALPELTEREAQILAQVARGLTNKEIARDLSLSEKTVKHHMTNVMQKLQVRNRVEAAMLFRRQSGNGRDAAPSTPERGTRNGAAVPRQQGGNSSGESAGTGIVTDPRYQRRS